MKFCVRVVFAPVYISEIFILTIGNPLIRPLTIDSTNLVKYIKMHFNLFHIYLSLFRFKKVGAIVGKNGRVEGYVLNKVNEGAL